MIGLTVNHFPDIAGIFLKICNSEVLAMFLCGRSINTWSADFAKNLFDDIVNYVEILISLS